jgi:hypothetical protein
MFSYTQTPVAPIAASKMRSLISGTRFNLQSAKNDHTPVDVDR